MALKRGQTLAQMSLAWVLRHPEVTSALVGASTTAQLEDAVGVLNNLQALIRRAAADREHTRLSITVAQSGGRAGISPDLPRLSVTILFK